MDAFWTPFVAVAAVFGVATASTAWWQQRRRAAGLQRQLETSELSRREMADHLLEMRKQLEVANVGHAESEISERRRALEKALDLATPVAEFPWLETMPAGNEPEEDHSFEPTRPSSQRVDLNLEETPGH